MQEWPLRSYLELRAVPASVRTARLHARAMLREWCLAALADTAELLVSEIATNAVLRIGPVSRRQRGTGHAADAAVAHLGPAQRADPGLGRRPSPAHPHRTWGQTPSAGGGCCWSRH